MGSIVLLVAIRLRMICYANTHRSIAMTIQTMLAHLFNIGFSQAAIAESCGSTQATICRIAKGASARYETGKLIEAIYLDSISLETGAVTGAQAPQTLNQKIRPISPTDQSADDAGNLYSTQQATA